jgi:hypothetical protein
MLPGFESRRSLTFASLLAGWSSAVRRFALDPQSGFLCLLLFRAGDLMQDLKTGALLKASPRSQFYGQMIGSLASVFVSAGAYKLYTRIYEVG